MPSALLHRPITRLAVWALLVLGTGAVPATVQAQERAAGQQGGLSEMLSAGQREQAELRRLLGQRAQLAAAQQKGEREQAQRAQTIERLKSQPLGVAPDLRLQEALAQAQAQATLLSQQAAELARIDQAVAASRARLLRACDAILLADGAPEKAGTDGIRLGAAERLAWLRLRTEQAEALLGPDELDERVRALAQRSAQPAAPGTELGAEPAVLDDPQVLRERADLLRDAADKLQREVARLKARSDEVQKRQRLRERAARVDEDLFAEQATARRAQRNDGRTAFESAAPQADIKAGVAPSAPGPTTTASDQSSGPTGPLRGGLDPSTLDVLQRAEGTGDPTARLQALQRAQTELNRLTEQLVRRATRLEQRARDLGQKK